MTDAVSDCLKTLPRVIKIGAYEWTVHLLEGDQQHGQTDFEPRNINLWPATFTSPSHCVGIVLHECLHVIYDNHNLVKSKRNKEAREEYLVSGFEFGLILLFRDNPKLMTWMKKGLK